MHHQQAWLGTQPDSACTAEPAHKNSLAYNRLLIYRLYIIYLSLLVQSRYQSDTSEVVKIGAQLRRAREGALLTQGELADRAGVGLPTISRIENGRVEPHFRTIRKLAKALDIDPAELVKEVE